MNDVFGTLSAGVHEGVGGGGDECTPPLHRLLLFGVRYDKTLLRNEKSINHEQSWCVCFQLAEHLSSTENLECHTMPYWLPTCRTHLFLCLRARAPTPLTFVFVFRRVSSVVFVCAFVLSSLYVRLIGFFALINLFLLLLCSLLLPPIPVSMNSFKWLDCTDIYLHPAQTLLCYSVYVILQFLITIIIFFYILFCFQ